MPPDSVQAHLAGIHARSEALIQVTRRYDRGLADAEALGAAFAEDTAALLELQRRHGLSPLSDGQLRWPDLLRPFVEGLDGVEPGGLTRWFNNNTFFERPRVISQIGRLRPLLAPYVGGELEGGGILVLPGPFTFAAVAEDHHYGDRRALMHDYAAAVAAELAEVGGRYAAIQFDEPALVYGAGAREPTAAELDGLARELEAATAPLEVPAAVLTYFGDVAPRWAALRELPVDAVGFDLYASSPDSLDRLSAAPLGDKVLVLGALDARGSLLEPVEAVVEVVGRLRDALRPAGLRLTPTTGLEYLPREVADRKVELLGRLRERLA